MMRNLLAGTSVALLFVILSGCAAAPVALGLAVDVTAGTVGIYQRYQDHQIQKEQNEGIAQFRKELNALRRAIDQSKPVAERRESNPLDPCAQFGFEQASLGFGR